MPKIEAPVPDVPAPQEAKTYWTVSDLVNSGYTAKQLMTMGLVGNFDHAILRGIFEAMTVPGVSQSMFIERVTHFMRSVTQVSDPDEWDDYPVVTMQTASAAIAFRQNNQKLNPLNVAWDKNRVFILRTEVASFYYDGFLPSIKHPTELGPSFGDVSQVHAAVFCSIWFGKALTRHRIRFTANVIRRENALDKYLNMFRLNTYGSYVYQLAQSLVEDMYQEDDFYLSHFPAFPEIDYKDARVDKVISDIIPRLRQWGQYITSDDLEAISSVFSGGSYTATEFRADRHYRSALGDKWKDFMSPYVPVEDLSTVRKIFVPLYQCLKYVECPRRIALGNSKTNHWRDVLRFFSVSTCSDDLFGEWVPIDPPEYVYPAGRGVFKTENQLAIEKAYAAHKDLPKSVPAIKKKTGMDATPSRASGPSLPFAVSTAEAQGFFSIADHVKDKFSEVYQEQRIHDIFEMMKVALVVAEGTTYRDDNGKECPKRKTPSLVVSDVYIEPLTPYEGITDEKEKKIHTTDTYIWSVQDPCYDRYAQLALDGSFVLAKHHPQCELDNDGKPGNITYNYLAEKYDGLYVGVYTEARPHNGELYLVISSEELIPERQKIMTDTFAAEITHLNTFRMKYANAMRNILLSLGIPTLHTFDSDPPYGPEDAIASVLNCRLTTPHVSLPALVNPTKDEEMKSSGKKGLAISGAEKVVQQQLIHKIQNSGNKGVSATNPVQVKNEAKLKRKEKEVRAMTNKAVVLPGTGFSIPQPKQRKGNN